MENWLRFAPLHFLHRLSYRFKFSLLAALLTLTLLLSTGVLWIGYQRAINYAQEQLQRTLVQKNCSHC